MLQGYQRWVGDANHHGGLLGRPVQLRVYDDRSDPATAASLYRKLIADDRVDLLAGPYASAVSQAVIPVVEEQHKVMIGQTAGTTLFDGAHYAVQGFPQGSTYLPGVADTAKNAGYRTVALLANDSPGTVEICGGLRSRAQALGLTVVLDRTYPRTTTAFAAYAAAGEGGGRGRRRRLRVPARLDRTRPRARPAGREAEARGVQHRPDRPDVRQRRSARSPRASSARPRGGRA